MHLVLKGMWVQGTGEDSKRKSINNMGTGTKTSLNSDFSVFLGKCCFHSKENSIVEALRVKQHGAAQEMTGKSRLKCRKRENDKCGQMGLSRMSICMSMD